MSTLNSEKEAPVGVCTGAVGGGRKYPNT